LIYHPLQPGHPAGQHYCPPITQGNAAPKSACVQNPEGTAFGISSMSKNLLARQRPWLPCVRGAVILLKKSKMTEGLSKSNVTNSP